ncbi:MAG TPA: hypothetical protein VHS06_04620, partial [Chloroflexota bacterium]|nr:hypothetical protein [Chloroflexota bacterium]
QIPGVYPLSDLTARTFASGLDTHGESDPSFLSKLNDEILSVKDLTTILEMHQEERQAVLAQLREIYDGRFDKVWGTGKELHWQGRLGFLAGVTPVIDQHYAVMGLLGPRFVQLRLRGGDRQQVAIKAIANSRQEEMRQELAGATAAFVSAIPNRPPVVHECMRPWLAQVADLATKSRSPVVRDGWRREIEYAPEPESPARLARQLYALLQGVTLVCGREQAGADDARRVARVALDCIPAIRRSVLETLVKTESFLKTSDVSNSAQHANTTVRRALEDLHALGLVMCRKGGEGRPDEWRLTDECRAMMAAATTVPEISEGCPNRLSD